MVVSKYTKKWCINLGWIIFFRYILSKYSKFIIITYILNLYSLFLIIDVENENNYI